MARGRELREQGVKGGQVDTVRFAEVKSGKLKMPTQASMLYQIFGGKFDPATDKVTLAGGVVNGWNNLVENNTGKTIWGQIVLKPTSAFTFIQNYTGGPEQTNDNADWRHLSDTQAMVSGFFN